MSPDETRKLRLLLWEDCLRECDGCCNQDWDLKSLPVCRDYLGYQLIMLTGGEPLLYPERLRQIITGIRAATSARLILYSAANGDPELLHQFASLTDGLTLTLHEQSDVEPFLRFLEKLKQMPLAGKSWRLNIFKGVSFDAAGLSWWQVKYEIVWVKNSPLPANEEFMRLLPAEAPESERVYFKD